MSHFLPYYEFEITPPHEGMDGALITLVSPLGNKITAQIEISQSKRGFGVQVICSKLKGDNKATNGKVRWVWVAPEFRANLTLDEIQRIRDLGPSKSPRFIIEDILLV